MMEVAALVVGKIQEEVDQLELTYEIPRRNASYKIEHHYLNIVFCSVLSNVLCQKMFGDHQILIIIKFVKCEKQRKL